MSETVEHLHKYLPSNGTVTIKVERNSRSTNFEIRIERPIDERAIDTGLDILQDIARMQRAIDDPESDYNRMRQLIEKASDGNDH